MLDLDKDWKMSCSALFLTLGILSSLVFQDVSTVRLPIAGNNINTITGRIFFKSNEDLPRSLKVEDSTLSMVPTSSVRVISPTILRLHPPLSAKPTHAHATLPLRFGRDSPHMHRTTKSSINLPQRFGRSGDTKPTSGLGCTACRRSESPPSATLPQRFGKRNHLFGDPFLAGAVFARSLEMPSFKDRTPDRDYMIEIVEKEDKPLKSKNVLT